MKISHIVIWPASLALTLTIGCGPKKPDSSEVLAEQMLEESMGVKQGETQPEPEVLEEVDGCLVEIRQTMIEGGNRDYVVNTEQQIHQSRMNFRPFCGSALPVEIDWPSVFISRGYEEGEEVGAVASATKVFLDTSQPVCNSSKNDAFRSTVKRVILTPTDSAERIGVCMDDASGTVVVRFMLTPGDATATSVDPAALTQFYDEIL